MADARRLGRIRLRDDPRREPPAGRPRLRRAPRAAAARRASTRCSRARRADEGACCSIRSFAAGVGNWIADEVLYQARIAPAAPPARSRRLESARLRSPPPRRPHHRQCAPAPTATASHAPGSSTAAGTTTRWPAPRPARASAGKRSAAARPPGLPHYRDSLRLFLNEGASPARGLALGAGPAREPAGAPAWLACRRRSLRVRLASAPIPQRGVRVWPTESSSARSPNPALSTATTARHDGAPAGSRAGPAPSATHAVDVPPFGKSRTLTTGCARRPRGRVAAQRATSATAEMTLAAMREPEGEDVAAGASWRAPATQGPSAAPPLEKSDSVPKTVP